MAGRLGQGPGQAEVGDAEPALVVEQEVGRLDVAVHECRGGGRSRGPRRLQPDEGGLRRREPVALVEQVAQAAAAQVLEHEERSVVVLAPVEDPHDVRVVQAGGGLGLGPEPAQEGLVLGQRRVQHLHRHPAAQHHVVGHEHVGRGTRSHGREEPVPASEDATDVVGDPRRCHPARLAEALTHAVTPVAWW